MKFVQLICPEGAAYVEIADVSAIGPMMRDKDRQGDPVELRMLYLRGGQVLVVFDSAENMQKLFDFNGAKPS